eukprot:TRINITY_DN844_c0_g1_i1.p1 TRINITY_DN844_c0_g1~~TRINITY_DN844_c0_g1_i1.p1  ORF type:complete len:321 (-),score=72.29 TRINITY_DN844_c0_g1_i1:19-981(-)
MSKRLFEEANIWKNIQEGTALQPEKKQKDQKGGKKDLKNFKKELGKTPSKPTDDKLTNGTPIWRNRQRVMVLSNRGTKATNRHLMKNIRSMLPHSKKESKLETKEPLAILNEMAEMHSCSSIIFFETKRNEDCYMWVARPEGPSAKFYISNVHTLEELKLMGNCLMGSRPILSFDPEFDSAPHWQLIKEMFTQIFGVPKGHPRSKPFIDHMICFYLLDGRIWVRQYQITEIEGEHREVLDSLSEIGPRFILHLIKIQSGGFGGPLLFSNGEYVSPHQMKRAQRREANEMHKERLGQKKEHVKSRNYYMAMPKDPLADTFK